MDAFQCTIYISSMMEHTTLEQSSVSPEKIMESSGTPSFADKIVAVIFPSSSQACISSTPDKSQSSEDYWKTHPSNFTYVEEPYIVVESCNRETKHHSFSRRHAFPTQSACWYHKKFRDQVENVHSPAFTFIKETRHDSCFLH